MILKNLPQNWRIFFAMIGVILLLWILWIFRSILAYLIIAVVVSFICDPMVNLLKKIKIGKFQLPGWLRAIISLLLLLSILVGLVALFTPLVQTEMEVLAAIDAEKIAQQIRAQLLNFPDMDLTRHAIQAAQGVFTLDWFQSLFNNVFGYVGNILIGLFSVFFIAFFFIKDGFLFSRIMFTLTPGEHIEKVKTIIEHTHGLLKRYFIGLMIQSLIMTIIVGIALSLLGVQNALLIGLLAGVANVIPYLGPWIGASIGVLIALTTSLHLDFNTAVLPLLIRVVLVFVGAQQIDNLIVQPLVMGNSVKAHPLEIFIVVLMAGTVGGIMGMIVAIPVYTVLRVVAREFLSEFKIVESLTKDLPDEPVR